MGPAEIMDALADQIQRQLAASIGTADPIIADLQVYQRLTWNPTPPTIDIYPGDDPFMEALGMDRSDLAMNFTIRARVATPEHEGAQDLLLAMMDPAGDLSVSAAITAAGTASPSKTLGGLVENVTVEGPSQFGVFTDPGSVGGAFLGCTWRARVIP